MIRSLPTANPMRHPAIENVFDIEVNSTVTSIAPGTCNTDGGGLCNNHPINRGGITKIIEAVRQLRGEAHPKVQVPNCDLAVVHGTGGLLGVRHAASTAILERV